MKAGWKVTPVGKVCTVIAGQSPEGHYYNAQGDGLPFFQGKKDFQEKHIGEARVWTSNVTKEAQRGDILMSVRAPVGPINFATQRCCIGRGLAAIRAGQELDSDFLYYVLLSKESEISGSEGAIFASINKSEIEAIKIPLPPLEEQRRIVGVLDKAFVGIATATANTQKNLINARALFHEFLLAAFAASHSETIGTTLGKLVSIQSGFAFKSSEYVESGHFLIRIGNVQDGYVALTNPKYVMLDKRTMPFELKAGDILTSLTGNIGRVAVVQHSDLPAALNQRVARLTMKPDMPVSERFVRHFLRSTLFRETLSGAGHGTAQQNVSPKEIGQIAISYPPLKFQNEVCDKLDRLADSIEAVEDNYQHKIAALAELKQSLLQKAFAGELT